MRRLIEYARAHLFAFALVKFCAGLVIGFGLGVYFLPILTAEEGLSQAELSHLKQEAAVSLRTGTFTRDLPGSDAFHWGEGTIHVSAERIWLDGQIAPGPDYRLYLTKGQIMTKNEFLPVKQDALQIAPIKAYKNFSVTVPDGLDLSGYDSVLIWCEAFSAFITSARLN